MERAEIKVLIVEDDQHVAQKLKLLLTKVGYHVVAIFAAAENALQELQQLNPNIVLMDIVLEGEMDGIEAAGVIKQQYHIPVVYLTAYSNEELLLRAKVTEPYAYILKPFQARELEMAIEIALYKHGAEREILEKKNHLEKAQQVGHMCSWEWDIKNDAIKWSKEFFQMFGLTTDEIGTTYADYVDLIHPADRKITEIYVKHAMDQYQPLDVEHRISLPNGDVRFVHENATVEFNKKGEAVRMTGVIQDVTKQHYTESKLQQYFILFQNASEGVIITDSENCIEMVNDAYCEITGYARHEIMGKNPKMMKSDFHDEDFYKHMWQSIKQTGKWQGEIWDKRKNGELYPMWLSIITLQNKDGGIQYHLGIFSDITELKQKEQRLHRLAYYDFLTGVANRYQFLERLGQEIAIAQRTGCTLAVLYIDLDRFKNINDCYGHAVGDKLLCQVSKRIRERIRESDTIARIGGDEFSVILTAMDDGESAGKVAASLIESLNKTFAIGPHELDIGISIGISFYPRDGEQVDNIVLNADRAMYKAKETGGNCYVFSNEELNNEIEQRLFLDSNLRKALEKGQFELYYQPQFELDSRRIIGMEALIRWRHPDKGMILPSDFIPRAEATNMIMAIGDWVLKTACIQNNLWQRQGLASVPVAVNFSAAQLRSHSIIKTIRQCLSESGLAPQYLDIEITESLSMAAPELTVDIISQLRELGALASIDDFGTGYSSLSHLKRLPVSKLKIDRAFVDEITSDENDISIATAVIQLAKSMQLKVIAEGVETIEQLEVLKNLGCDYGQGYYYARPMPAEDMGDFLATHQ